MANYALILAGGVGARTEQSIPKQFISVNDKPIIVYTMQTFENCESIDGIVVSCLAGWKEPLKAYVKQYNISKFIDVVDGGETRLDSIKKGVERIAQFAEEEDVVVTHDAVRALVSEDIILDSCKVASAHNIAVSLSPVVDTMYNTKDGVHITNIVDRDYLACGHTPVSAKLSYCKHLFKEIENKKLDGGNCIATATLILNEKLHGSKSTSKNIKITTKEDIEIFKGIKLLEKQSKN